MHCKNRIATLIIGVLLLALWGGSALAADWPDRPVTLIIPYSPGAATDLQARIMTMNAGKEDMLGQPIVVVNKPGAGGQVAWNWVVEKAPTDGYTMVSYNLPHFIAQSIKYETKYDYRSFEPVANWGADPAVLVVEKDSPFKTVKDFVDYARENPGKVTMSGSGMYTGFHIGTLQLGKAAGVKLTYIPEAGAAPALQSIIANKVKGGFTNISDAYRNKDRLRVLAIADFKRNELFPQVPTLIELGYDVDNSSTQFRGVAFPKGTDPAIIAKGAEIFAKMFNDPEVIKVMKESGCPLHFMNREEVLEMFQKRQQVYSDLLNNL